ncbi:MAG: hypothetical protein KAS86_02270 [Candidatus Omnitrophica bacterium]|nr:hypothetical protein [Candidatus Omnitrophota bacterium]
MKNTLMLYVLLLVSLSVQICPAGYSVWAPDVVLLLVVFTATLRGLAAGLRIGLVAGFLRGVFSACMFPLDIVLYPAVGMVSALMSGMLYGQSPVVQIFITGIAVFLSNAAHVLYLNALSGNDIAVSFVLVGNWRGIVVTMISAPFVFLFLKKLSACQAASGPYR